MILLQRSSTSYCSGMENLTDSKEQQQFQNKKMQVYQPKDRLDMEIEELRMLMVNMSQRRNEERMNIYIIRANRQNNNIRQMIEEDCRSKASGALQQKIWKPRELQPVKR